MIAQREYRDTFAAAMVILTHLARHGGRRSKSYLAKDAHLIYTQKVWGYLMEKGLVMMSLEEATFREGVQQFVYLTDGGRRVLKEWKGLRELMK